MQSTSADAVTIETVDRARQRDAFVRLPWRIYRDDPHWVPPLIGERNDFINPRKHPFYRHGQAVQLLARHQGQVVGRIQVSDDPHYNAQHGTNLGSFGLFESVDDRQVAAALLDSAAAWLAGRGRNRIMGPVDYSTNYACGLLVDGFDTPPRVMTNHNPRYYAHLLESWGLTKAKDVFSWWFDDPLDLARRWQKRAERLAVRGNVTVRPLDLHNPSRDLDRVKAIYNDAWANNWGFVQPSDAELRYFAKLLIDLAVPEMFLLAEVGGMPAGVALTLPDVNEALLALDGRLIRWGLPLGYLQLRYRLKRVKACRLFALGVTEKHRHRGVVELLILRTLDYAKNVAGYAGAELSWTLENNRAVNHTIQAVGGSRYKTYRIYDKKIPY